MERKAIADTVGEIISRYLDDDTVEFTGAMKLQDDISLSSLGLAMILSDIEEFFHFRFEYEDIFKLITFADLVDYIESRTNHK